MSIHVHVFFIAPANCFVDVEMHIQQNEFCKHLRLIELNSMHTFDYIFVYMNMVCTMTNDKADGTVMNCRRLLRKH